ncbi:MAG: SAM-dependent methyltransferase [Rickettsiales bacterium]|nr:SAM-dependent methyltransferase [Rickettsiales bacterium]
MQKISDFMHNALFDDKTGYYRTKNPIGKNSDFITAPEISQVFGEILAAYILQIAATKKSPIALVEMGAGKGTLFFDILSTIKKLAQKNISQASDFLERSTFHIIEINSVLREIQQKKLSDFKVDWHENFDDFSKYLSPLSPGFDSAQPTAIKLANAEIFFISNELFDCFPIDQFVLTESGWRERMILEKKFTLADFDKKTHEFVESEIGSLAPVGAVFEYSSSARNFMSQLCELLKRQGGMAINIDYGYVKNEFVNTLQALKNHQKVDVLENAPESDISALVDFNSLVKIVKTHNLNSSLISQKEFLTALGIEERRAKLLAVNSQKSAEINSAIDRLINSDQMGDLFKCLILWK